MCVYRGLTHAHIGYFCYAHLCLAFLTLLNFSMIELFMIPIHKQIGSASSDSNLCFLHQTFVQNFKTILGDGQVAYSVAYL